MSNFICKSNDMFFWNKVCAGLIFFFFITSTSFSQSKADISLKGRTVYKNQVSFSEFTLKNKIIKLDYQLPNNLKPDLKVAPDQVSCKYGFFCKNEWKMEKITRVPFRFRIGSLEQCDFYENRK